MTTLASTATRTPAPAFTVSPPTFRRLLTAEWIAFRSLRSRWWILAGGVVLFPLLSVARVTSIARVPEAAGAPSVVGAVYVTSGVMLTHLVLATLGVLVVAGDHATGQIRTTFTAVPRRLPALAAKLVVTLGAVLAASTLGVVLGWAAGAPWFDVTGMSISLTSAEDLRLLVGVPLYLAGVTALGFALGAILRSPAGAVAAVLGLLLVVENALGAIPWGPTQTLAAHLPASAGNRLLQSDAFGSVVTTSSTTLLSPWAGYAVMLAWVAALLAVAAVLVRQRDV